MAKGGNSKPTAEQIARVIELLELIAQKLGVKFIL